MFTRRKYTFTTTTLRIAFFILLTSYIQHVYWYSLTPPPSSVFTAHIMYGFAVLPESAILVVAGIFWLFELFIICRAGFLHFIANRRLVKSLQVTPITNTPEDIECLQSHRSVSSPYHVYYSGGLARKAYDTFIDSSAYGAFRDKLIKETVIPSDVIHCISVVSEDVYTRHYLLEEACMFFHKHGEYVEQAKE